MSILLKSSHFSPKEPVHWLSSQQKRKIQVVFVYLFTKKSLIKRLDMVKYLGTHKNEKK